MRGTIYPKSDVQAAIMAGGWGTANVEADVAAARRRGKKSLRRCCVEYVLTMGRMPDPTARPKAPGTVPFAVAKAAVLRAAESTETALSCNMPPFWRDATEAGALWAARKKSGPRSRPGARASRAGWKPGRVRIMGATSERTEYGYVKGIYGIYRLDVADGFGVVRHAWCVTHLPTGFEVMTYRRKDRAMRLANALPQHVTTADPVEARAGIERAVGTEALYAMLKE